MDNFLPQEQSPFLVLLNIVLLFFIYSQTQRAIIVRNNNIPELKIKWAILLMLLFVIFSFWGWDWFYYFKDFKAIKLNSDTNLETIYYWIAQNLSPNYLMFRFIIWGGSLFLLLHSFKRLTVPFSLLIFFFGSIYLIWFSYARVSVAMVLVFYGLTIWYKPYSNTKLSKIIAIGAIVSAYFFHKSALFGIVIGILTIFSHKIEKKTFLFLLLCYPFWVYFAQMSIDLFLITDMNNDNSVLNENMMVGQRYMNNEIKSSGWGYLISTFLEKFPYFILCFISIKLIHSKIYKIVPDDIKAFIRYLILSVLLSSIFMFDLGANTKIIFERFIRFAAIPASIVFSYLYMTKYKFKLTVRTFRLAILGTYYALFYAMYCVYVNS